MTAYSRNERLMQARHATESAPVSTVRYTDREQAQRLACKEALIELRALSAKWAAENQRQVAARAEREALEALREHNDRLMVIREYIRAQGAKRRAAEQARLPEIVTSAPVVKLTPDHVAFPLCRPVLRGKAAPKSERRPVRRESAIGNFFQAVSIFLHS